MELQCESCHTPLEQAAATQLLCGHRYHTQCFLHSLEVAIVNEIPHQARCVSCHTDLFFFNEEDDGDANAEETYGPENNPELQDQETPEVTERQRVHALWDTNQQFQTDLKTYIQAERDISKPRKAFQKLLITKKRELNEIYMPIKLRLEGIYNTKKDELMDSTESKTYRKALARSQRYYTHVRTKYNLHNSSFRYLREKRGCKRLYRSRRRWYTSPQWMIRRAIRFRFRHY